MPNVTDSQIEAIGSVLCDENRPLKERFRALFTLRNIGGPVAIGCISRAFTDSSALLKHELAYCLGQMQDERAINVLIDVLEDTGQEPMVRHEAAEALGAIGALNSSAVLEKFAEDPVQEVRETCELALDRIEWVNMNDGVEPNPYKSIDPAPAMHGNDVEKLKSLLLDDNRDLFDRYGAMFSLRNVRSRPAVLALCEGLKSGSSLFRHEVAFVLGQLQDEASVPFLSEALCDTSENEMVRHECAEALGAIATQGCYDVLRKYLEDEKRVVKESCEIALDMCEYENSPEFQYANTLQSV